MIQIYKDEQSLADKLSDNRVLANCQVLPKINKHKIDVEKLSLAAEYDKDLYRLHTIMVSTGINKNDDVFLKRDLWTAKETPVDKPLNIEHNPKSIVGHIIASSMIDDEYELVEELDEEDDITETTYHLLTAGVIYRHIKSVDEDLEKESAKLISEIDNGEWYVSMECLFGDFDYALIHPVFGKRCIKRNESTAFLTKYLRRYGGEGYYNGMRIGRVLKDLVFSGKGLVKNPANPNSIILNNVDVFGGSYASISDLNLDKEEILDMAENFETKYSEAQNEIKELRDRLIAAGEEQHKQALKVKDEEISQLTATITDMQKKIDELVTKINEVSKAKETIESSKADVDTKVKELESELKKINDEKIKVDRVSVLVSAGVDKTEAEKLVERFASITDEQFADIVELQKKIILANVEEKVEEVVEASEDVVSEEVLETAEETEEVALSTEIDEKDEFEKTQADFSKWFDSAVLKEKVNQ